jgi:hypothetical protein
VNFLIIQIEFIRKKTALLDWRNLISKIQKNYIRGKKTTFYSVDLKASA